MRRNLIIAASILTMSAGTAFAQTPPAAGQPAPATGTGARPAAAAPAPTGTLGRNVATSAVAAKQAADAAATARGTACKAKGALYVWKPPHSVGEPDGKGGFYTTNFGGSCRAMVSGKQMEALRAAGLLKQ